MEQLDIKKFQDDYKRIFEDIYAYDVKDGTASDQYQALGQLVRSYYSDEWRETMRTYREELEKQVYYFSMEFLPGRMLKNNLLNMGILPTVRQGIEELGLDFEAIARAEADPALGNGGLGRLASCFMDSIAANGIAGNGNGIRYKYGLFKQSFVDGYQIELPENWLRHNNAWEVRREDKAVVVRFGGKVELLEDEHKRMRVMHTDTNNILAVPYDTPQLGYQNEVVNNLRLWNAEIPFGEEVVYNTEAKRAEVQGISEVLYPDDSNYEGRLLRLKQEYFFVSAGVQSIVRYFSGLNLDWVEFPEKVQIHVNDTHPVLAIPELMRILMDEEGFKWAPAWETTKKTISYTNHTVLQEAMERWPEEMMAQLLPRIYQIIKEIDRRHVMNKSQLYTPELAEKTRPIENGQIKMANVAILGAHSVNGVAKLHTEILQEDTLHDFYVLYPQKFNNKTNGVTPRRWLQLANEPLSNYIDSLIGTEWRKELRELTVLKAYANDKDVLDKIGEIKLANKQKFAAYVKDQMGIEISTDAIFDVQIKRLHAYKRQLMNVLHIIHRYLEIKDGRGETFQPRVFIFGAKAAPSYHYAKQIIKLINELANLINNDQEIGDKLKIVFVENYGVSLAELIIPAAEISEQISTAGKEASGTSNMKLMANGAITLATLDGANIEIHESVGDENIIIFGLKNNEVQELNRSGTYNPRDIYEKNPQLNRVLNALVDGTIPNIQAEGQDIFDSLVTYNDEYYVLKDFNSYMKAHERADGYYKDTDGWNRKALLNIAAAGPFSSDYTIRNYARDIWQIETAQQKATRFFKKK